MQIYFVGDIRCAAIRVKHCIMKIIHFWEIQLNCWQIQHCRSRVSTISNPKSSLNKAICLFYNQTFTIHTPTDCLVVENQHGEYAK